MFFNPNEKPYINSILAFGGFGYSFDITETFNVYIDLSVGGNSLIADSSFSEVASYILNAGFEHKITDSLCAKYSCRGEFEYSLYNDVSYLNFKIIPTIGLSVSVR